MNLFSRSSKTQASCPARGRRYHLDVESLEGRAVPSTVAAHASVATAVADVARPQIDELRPGADLKGRDVVRNQSLEGRAVPSLVHPARAGSPALVQSASASGRVLYGSADGLLTDLGNIGGYRTYEINATGEIPPLGDVRVTGRIHGTLFGQYSGGTLNLVNGSGQTVGVVSLGRVYWQGQFEAPAQGFYSYKVTEGEYTGAIGVAKLDFGVRNFFSIDFSSSAFLSGGAEGGTTIEVFGSHIKSQPTDISPFGSNVTVEGSITNAGFGYAKGWLEVFNSRRQWLGGIHLAAQQYRVFVVPNGLYGYQVEAGAHKWFWGTADLNFYPHNKFAITLGN
jgi:hypothetical protein